MFGQEFIFFHPTFPFSFIIYINVIINNYKRGNVGDVRKKIKVFS